jgi:hypothetical protein
LPPAEQATEFNDAINERRFETAVVLFSRLRQMLRSRLSEDEISQRADDSPVIGSQQIGLSSNRKTLNPLNPVFS